MKQVNVDEIVPDDENVEISTNNDSFIRFIKACQTEGCDNPFSPPIVLVVDIDNKSEGKVVCNDCANSASIDN